MNVKFSVPEFPLFEKELNANDYRRYTEHIKRFEGYAAYIIQAQVKLAEKAVEKGYMESELAQLRDATKDIIAASVNAVERSAVISGSEIEQVRECVAAEVSKLPVVEEFPRFDRSTPTEIVVNVANDGSGRGPKWSRNNENRINRKLRKIRRQQEGFDWRKRSAVGDRASHQGGPAVDSRGDQAADAKKGTSSGGGNGKCDLRDAGDLASVENPDDAHPNAFWKNCSEKDRRALIDSKAAMHIAENERKTHEARARIKQLTSAFHVMKESVKMAEYAQELAKNESNSKVFNWAAVVASSSAESVARSAPSSAPSFDSHVTRTTLDEMAKFEAEKMAYQEEIAVLKSDKLKFAAERDEEKRKGESYKSTVEKLKKRVREFEAGESHPLAATIVARRPGESRREHIVRANVYLRESRSKTIPLDA